MRSARRRAVPEVGAIIGRPEGFGSFPPPAGRADPPRPSAALAAQRGFAQVAVVRPTSPRSFGFERFHRRPWPRRAQRRVAGQSPRVGSRRPRQVGLGGVEADPDGDRRSTVATMVSKADPRAASTTIASSNATKNPSPVEAPTSPPSRAKRCVGGSRHAKPSNCSKAWSPSSSTDGSSRAKAVWVKTKRLRVWLGWARRSVTAADRCVGCGEVERPLHGSNSAARCGELEVRGVLVARRRTRRPWPAVGDSCGGTSLPAPGRDRRPKLGGPPRAARLRRERTRAVASAAFAPSGGRVRGSRGSPAARGGRLSRPAASARSRPAQAGAVPCPRPPRFR